jgi:membrane associated rhomboid family serine protease
MKTIKTYLTNLPIGVKTMVGINLFFYLVSCISLFIFSFDINYLLGFHPTHSGEFKFNQLFTFMFTHSYDPTHITVNLILLLFFSVSFENKFGLKNYVLMYVLSSIFCVMSFNTFKNYENKVYKQLLIDNGVFIEKLDSDTFNRLDKNQQTTVNKYDETFQHGVGASGALLGFVATFIFFNLQNLKKIKIILLYIISSYILYFTFEPLFPYDFERSGSSVGHIGGFVCGLLYSIYLTIKKRILN